MLEGGEKILTANLISEYEDLIRSLQIQLEISTEEHKNLKEEILQLISENQSISRRLEAEYRERLKESVDADFSDSYKTDIVANLQNQLEICRKDKEKTLELYKTSLKLIEKLEEELSLQQGNLLEKTQLKVSTPTPSVTVLESKLKTTKEHLEIALEGREKVESENIKHQTEIAKLRINIESNSKVIDELKVREEKWKEKCNKTEQEYTLLNATYECVVQSRNELEKKLDLYTMKMQELIGKNNESKSKVAEALDVIEKAISEKDLALLRERQLKEEVYKLQLSLEHVITEAGKKAGMEIEENRKKYEENMKKLLEELTEFKKELEKKKIEHKKISFKYKKLEKVANAKLDEEKISIIKGSETEIAILENHLESVYQDLERLKIKYDDLMGEKKNIEEKFSGLVEKNESLIKEKESRESFWKKMVEELKTQIDQKLQDLNEASRRTEFFLNQVKELQQENFTLKQSVKSCVCEKLKGKIKKVKEEKNTQKKELESHIEALMNVNENWKKEVKEISKKFEEKIQELKIECGNLKVRNKNLVAELNSFKKKIQMPDKFKDG